MRLRAVVCLLLLAGSALAAEPPKMKFDEVKEIAPGVFFRYSSISATDKTVTFGGSNHTWVVFDDHVVVIDANFPKEAGDVIAAIKKTTDKPIRYVLDTHHHGDHAYGNAVWAKEGATIVASAGCARLMRTNGPREFAEAGKPPTGRKDVADSSLKVPGLIFDDKLVLDDGKQRVELLFLGHAHTAGDAVAYLPKHKILCTGDACVNGAFNYMGHSDSASWVRTLEKMQQLDVEFVCPGHGPIATKDLLEKQKRYFVDLRAKVRKGVEEKKTPEEIHKGLDMAWYKEWTGVEPAMDNVKHVHAELTGRVAPWDLAEDFGIYEGPSLTKDTPGWKAPKRIVVPSGLMPPRLAELKAVAPDVEFVPARTEAEAAKLAADADAVLGFVTPDVLRAGKSLRWVQPDAVNEDLLKAAKDGGATLTDTRRAYDPGVADQTFALLLGLARGRAKAEPAELHGKTLVVVGLGGVGTQVARRAQAFGMRVRAVDEKPGERPDFVFSLDSLAKLPELLPNADAVVIACPLTARTKGLIGAKELSAMKKTAYLLHLGRSSVVDLAALAEALEKGKLAGAGLDVSDPTPVPDTHPLRKRPEATFAAHSGGVSPEGQQRQWRVYRENVRRFAVGEPLLCVIEP